MNAASLLFFVCAVVCVVGALSTVAAKNPIRGAVGLLATILGIAGLFLALEAEFLAAIQLIVYAGAPHGTEHSRWVNQDATTICRAVRRLSSSADRQSCRRAGR